MNRRRSPLDTINAGRKRRPTASIEDLDRMLARMEGREPARAPLAERRPLHTEPAPRREPIAAAASRETLRDATRELERSRQVENGYANMSRIAAELKSMREELRSQVGSGLQREFEQVRNEIRRIGKNAETARPQELGAEFSRLSDAVQSLSERSDDKPMHVLRLELEQVRKSLENVAREDTVKSVGRRWDDFDARWSALENRIGTQGGEADSGELKALGGQIERISSALASMPDSKAMRSLEDKVRVLTGSVDQIAKHYGSVTPEALTLIESRLDEISRAIVVSSSMAHPVSFDPEPFERIEARMTSLASQIDELIEDRPSAGLIEHINSLSGRVDEIAQRIELPETMVERLADQMAMIVDKLDREPVAPDLDIVFHNLETRFEHLSGMLEQRQDDAMEQGQQLFRELERRLDLVAERLDNQPVPQKPDTDGMMRAIDLRFAELAQKLDRPNADLQARSIAALESRLEDIALRLDNSARQPGVDPSVIASLEAQIAGMSAHLAQPGQAMPEYEDITPRLQHIEQAITSNREAMLEAARKAAIDAASSLSATQADTEALDGLTADLRALDALTRRSDERNAKTFEAIHDTLLKIVDRLGTLENARPEALMAGRAAADAPSLDMAEHDIHAPDPRRGLQRSPSEAAAAAASHALDVKEPTQAASPLSMLGGLTRALTSRKERPAADEKIEPASTMAAETDQMDRPLDPQLANQPLEPGSGAPDLGAIMKRVRDERGQPTNLAGADAAKADFIAAARRAAQAAAAEAEVAKRGGDAAGGGGKLKLGSILRPNRKTALLAATGLVVVLAGMQLSSAFFGSAPEAQQVSAVAEQPVVADAAEENTMELPAQASRDVTSQASAAGPVLQAETQTATDRPATEYVAAASPEADPFAAAPEGSKVDLFEEIKDDPDSVAENAADESVNTAALSVTPATEAPANTGPEALRAAADGGDPKAMYEIGSRYAEGRGVTADAALAADWYRRAAELGYAPAQYRMGNVHEKGIGVARDTAAARSWYLKAAEQGNASAMHNLAVLMAMGADAAPDNDGAARWFLEAAELGVKDSQFNLGILSAKGVGVPQSLEESYKWFALVADAGDRDAAAKRDEVAKAMRPEQLEKAKGAAKLWKPRPIDDATNLVDLPEEWAEGGVQTASVDMRQAVLNIQTILNKNGYDAGSADGIMGAKTRSAITQFQRDNGMPADGEVTEQLVKALLERR